jgi:uncharacterized protein
VSRYLLDVTVMVALLDPSHVHHERAHRWFTSDRQADWLSCPTTQNGVLRIVSDPRYSNAQPMSVVLDSLRSLLTVGSHTFVPDSISVLDCEAVETAGLLNSAQVTDSYLIALAQFNGAQLATFDTRIVTSAVVDGAETVCHIR